MQAAVTTGDAVDLGVVKSFECPVIGGRILAAATVFGLAGFVVNGLLTGKLR